MPVRPDLPVELRKAYRLGVLCARGHDYHGSGQSLRKRSNGGCVACDQTTGKRTARRKGQRSKRRQVEPSTKNGKFSKSCKSLVDQATPPCRGTGQAPDRRPEPALDSIQGQALAALPAGTTLGALCLYKHYHDGLPFSLRRQSDSRCVTCELLPDGIREVAFLSADLCAVASHRWRGTAWTLRYLHERHDCVQCSAQSKVSRHGPAVVQAAD